MKTKMIVYFLTLVSWSTFAQHDHGSGQGSTPVHNRIKDMSHSYRAVPAFQMQLREVFIASLELKEALVSSDAGKTSASTPEVKNSISKVDMSLLNDEALMDWMSYLKTLNESVEQISASTDLSLQRKAFASFSDALYKSVKMFGLGGMRAYHEFCPMANNKAGAYWLSDSKEIRNPYFGNDMLTCGKVKETIR